MSPTKNNKPLQEENTVPQRKTSAVGKITTKEQFDMLFNEYQIGLEHIKRYADYANLSLNYTYVFLAAMITGIFYIKSLLFYKVLCIYLLPLFVYIVGLMYIYTLFILGKVEYFLMCLEIKMRNLAKNKDIVPIQGWNLFMKKDGNASNFFVYGFLFLIFFALPIIAIIIGNTEIFYAIEIKEDTEKIVNTTDWHFAFKYIIPAALYLIYVFAGIIFITKNMKIRKKKKDELE